MRVDVRQEALSIAREVSPFAMISVWLRNIEANRSIDLPHGVSCPVWLSQICVV